LPLTFESFIFYKKNFKKNTATPLAIWPFLHPQICFLYKKIKIKIWAIWEFWMILVELKKKKKKKIETLWDELQKLKL
jgi:hypothetical protein